MLPCDIGTDMGVYARDWELLGTVFPLSGNRRHVWGCQHTEMGTRPCAQSDTSEGGKLRMA